MKIELRDVTASNREEVLGLRLKESQTNFIETVEECLNDAKECEYYVPVGLYIDDVLVGFAMYGLFPYPTKKGRVWLDRFLIDESNQGHGYGSILIEYLINFLHDKYGNREIYLSIYEDNTHAFAMYIDLGFEFNGELDENGEKVMVLPQ